jgi:hypothetical protein
MRLEVFRQAFVHLETMKHLTEDPDLLRQLNGIKAKGVLAPVQDLASSVVGKYQVMKSLAKVLKF